MNPFDRSRFLLVFGADPKRWAVRYDLTPFITPCADCDRPLTTTVPFACGPMRGLIAPRCPCGNDKPPYCILRVDGVGLFGQRFR